MTTPKGKQRSIHMDDETFELLQTLAAKHKINNSSVVRMALAKFADDRPAYPTPQPVAATPAADLGGNVEVPSRTEASSILPDPRVSSFNVSGGKVRQRFARNDREDDGLDV